MKKLEDLVVGDEIVVSSRNSTYIVTIDRITKTQIVTKAGKFNRSSGILIGDSWATDCINLDCDIPALKELNKKRNKIVRIKDLMSKAFDYSKMDSEKLTEIHDYLNGCIK